MTSTLTFPIPAADAVATPRFGTMDLPTGVSLHIAEYGPETASPVILLHGYSDSWFSFSRVAPLLAPEYRAFALDQRGHGRSTKPARGYHMSDLARDVLAFMDAMGLPRAVVVGHSMGSVVAQQVAAAAPDRVSGLGLIGAPTAIGRMHEILSLRDAVEPLTDPVPVDFITEFQYSTIALPVSEAFMRQVIEESRQLTAHGWRELMTGMLATDPAVTLRASGIPTLIMRGELDAMILTSEQDALAEMIGTAAIRIYRGAGHAPHWEVPEELAADLSAFVSSVLG
jgi:pimeloyl-ACP methyl ester carboxylesterase